MSGSGVKNFQAFEILAAADVNNYLMQQSVMVLPGTAAIGTAGTAIGTATTATVAPAEGMLVYLQDLNQYQMNLDGSASGWYPVAGQMPRIELTRTTTATNFFGSGNITTLSGWTVTESRGGFSESSGTVTVPYAGRYNIYGNFGYSSSTSGYRAWQITTSGTQTYRNILPAQSAAYSNINGIAATGIKLAAGDTVQLQGLQNSGGPLNWEYTSGYAPKLIIEYVGP